MKTFVILLNFLLISLILFSLFSRTDSIIENLEGCPPDKKNMVYKQQALLERLFSELNTIKAETKALSPDIASNTTKISANSQNAKSVRSDINDEKAQKMKELDNVS